MFLPLLEPARFKGAHGGRGSGKSHFFADLLVEECLLEQPMWAVCLREVQKDLGQSVKKLIESKIQARGLTHRFRILDDRIITPGDGRIIFAGLQDHTADSIKSLEGYKRAWIEEAQTVSERSLEILIPTIRAPGSQIWASWNPRSANDAIEQLLRGPDRRTNSLVVEVNYTDNPWLSDEMRQEELDDRRLRPDRHAHIWLGEYEPQAIGAIFNRTKIAENRRTQAQLDEEGVRFERIVVAVDHAVSAEKGSNEHGIIVAAKGEDERRYVLEDGSLSGTPTQWATRAVALFDKWGADAIVIERNQGGDLVRQTLESIRVGLPIVEVTATRGKHVRAEPIASRYEAGQVSHVGTFAPLEDQLCKITPAGYDGEGSPDRADALVWAMSELFPTMGEGAVYRTPESDFVIDPFNIPESWPKAFALHEGPDHTAVLWMARDTNVDTVYIYSEDLRENADIATKAASINLRGEGIPGVFSPAIPGRTEKVGLMTLNNYLHAKVSLNPLPDPLAAGTTQTANRLATGRLKVFRTCPAWLREYRSYHKGDDGKPVDDEHPLMRATRLLVVGGVMMARVPRKRQAHGERTPTRRVGY